MRKVIYITPRPCDLFTLWWMAWQPWFALLGAMQSAEIIQFPTGVHNTDTVV